MHQRKFESMFNLKLHRKNKFSSIKEQYMVSNAKSKINQCLKKVYLNLQINISVSTYRGAKTFLSDWTQEVIYELCESG